MGCCKQQKVEAKVSYDAVFHPVEFKIQVVTDKPKYIVLSPATAPDLILTPVVRPASSHIVKQSETKPVYTDDLESSLKRKVVVQQPTVVISTLNSLITAYIQKYSTLSNVNQYLFTEIILICPIQILQQIFQQLKSHFESLEEELTHFNQQYFSDNHFIQQKMRIAVFPSNQEVKLSEPNINDLIRSSLIVNDLEMQFRQNNSVLFETYIETRLDYVQQQLLKFCTTIVSDVKISFGILFRQIINSSEINEIYNEEQGYQKELFQIIQLMKDKIKVTKNDIRGFEELVIQIAKGKEFMNILKEWS
ncbi:Conserved_hypothetical protein [Hexamita inflata]|uniref:Uncharacterized protein n=1 Tax=Hexamita inflata TaxID=28002 RepID=A0AA86UNG6_9EUKA|nr:Conserved hypothetical protein [Hexamita inflata]